VIRRKYDIDKRCIKMNGSKNAKLLIKKKIIIYQRTKIQKLGSPKHERAKKTNLLYKMETLNHIIIYNLVFSSVINHCICNLYYMMSNVQMVALHLNLNYISNKLFLCYALNPINTQKPPNQTLTHLG
jgi:hypothetical protein